MLYIDKCINTQSLRKPTKEQVVNDSNEDISSSRYSKERDFSDGPGSRTVFIWFREGRRPKDWERGAQLYVLVLCRCSNGIRDDKRQFNMLRGLLRYSSITRCWSSQSLDWVLGPFLNVHQLIASQAETGK